MWKDILDFLNGDNPDFNLSEFFTNLISNVIFNFLKDLTSSLYDKIIEIMNTVLLTATDINLLKESVFNYTNILTFIQVISGALLVFLIALEAVERQAGSILNTKERSYTILIGKTILAGCFIYFLPTLFMEKILQINFYMINGIEQILNIDLKNYEWTISKDLGIKILTESDTFTIPWPTLIVFIAITIGFILLTFAAAFRYIELIIAILIAPFASAFFIKSENVLLTWFKETMTIIFTQTVHILLLGIALKISLDESTNLTELLQLKTPESFIKVILFIVILFLAVRAPRLLRQYIYSSGKSKIGSRISTITYIVKGGRI